MGAALLFAAGSAIAQVRSIGNVQVAIGASPPAAADAWSTVALPQHWVGADSPEPLDRWYRFEVVGGEGAWGVLLLDVAMNAAVSWNGEPLGDGGRFEPPMAQNFHRPLYFRVPASMVHPDRNEILIRVATPAHFKGWLAAVRTGPDALLAPLYQSELGWRQRLPQATSLLGGVMVTLLVAFWFASRDPTYAWFAATAGLASLANLNLHVQALPFSTMVWARGVQLMMCWHTLVQATFMHRFLGLERPRTERAFAIVAAAVALLVITIPDHFFLPVFTQLHLPTAALFFYPVVLLLVKVRTLPRIENVLLLSAGVLVTSLGLHDALIVMGGLPGEMHFWGPLAGPLVMFDFAIVLTLRFGRTLRRAERHNEELERRVHQKHEELEVQYQHLRDLEGERVLSQERQRIMREMHDGLGGRLVETLAMVTEGDAESGELADSLRASLDEMRLMIDSLDPLIGDLPSLLAAVRERLEPGLRRRGVALVWQVEELPKLTRLGPQGFLHLLRIVQEAFTNTARHARASQVVLAARVLAGGDRVCVSILDDGCGMANEARHGRGLGNMRERAAIIGGELDFESSGAGTRIQLVLPI